MLGEQEATVVQTRAFDLHGVTYHDVALKLADGSSVDGRLGPEAVPEGLTAGENVLATLAASLNISNRYFMPCDHGAFPVDEEGQTIGLLTLRGVKKLPQDEWPVHMVKDAMEPLADQCTVEVGDRMDQVMAKLQAGASGRCLVMRRGEVVGIITPSNIARWLQRRRALQGVVESVQLVSIERLRSLQYACCQTRTQDTSSR